jgi:hypothetical protein
MRQLCLFVVLLLTWPCAAQDNQVDVVVRKAVEAMGGLEKIHALHSLVYRGFHYEGSYQQEFVRTKTSSSVMVRMRPGLRLVGCRPEVPACNGQWGRIVEGFDGRRGWELNWPKQRLVRTVSKAEHALRCGAAFDYLFVDYKERGFTAKYLGRQRVLGSDVEAVQIDRPECGAGMVYYFDQETYLVRMTRAQLPIHARGDAVDTVAIYTKSLDVNGVRLLSREEEVNFKTGEVIDGVEWTSIEANTLDDPRIFQAPEVHPVGITAVMLKMLEQSGHDRPKTMMATYFAFRKSEEGKKADAVYDMNWLGYELLKVDKYQYALPVFLEIVREQPESADSYQNLGEAYLQMKDKENAIAAFDQALKLGAKDESIQKKLQRLKQG